jgi:hypothetical protein
MENIRTKMEKKFDNMGKGERVATITILTIIIGTFFFVSGVSIGEAFYGITH